MFICLREGTAKHSTWKLRHLFELDTTMHWFHTLSWPGGRFKWFSMTLDGRFDFSFSFYIFQYLQLQFKYFDDDDNQNRLRMIPILVSHFWWWWRPEPSLIHIVDRLLSQVFLTQMSSRLLLRCMYSVAKTFCPPDMAMKNIEMNVTIVCRFQIKTNIMIIW